MTRQPGRVIGDAGIGLTGDVSWAKNQAVADIGRKGELDTAALLNRLALQPGGPTVLHDLRIPIPGFKANIDHVVVSGRNITLIDTKVWRPGFYWTIAGQTRRGMERFPSAEKKTLPTGVDSITRFLDRKGVRAAFKQSVLVVWPSNQRSNLTLLLLRSPGARAVNGHRFATNPGRYTGARPADRHIVAALTELTN